MLSARAFSEADLGGGGGVVSNWVGETVDCGAAGSVDCFVHSSRLLVSGGESSSPLSEASDSGRKSVT